VRAAITTAIAAGAFAAAVAIASADDEPDHERARRAVEAGEALPLTAVLAAVERDYVGQVVEVELERDDGKWVYEIEVLTPAADVIELTYDARSGALLEAEGRGAAAARRPR
jgi:uncharacterized membrane protein YkoI